MKGFTLFEGASLLDGAPIVVIATLHTENAKTGDMVQTWILRADMKPTDAVKTGADASICGDCKHRGATNGKGRSCYVNVFQAPYAVYAAWQRGVYPRATWEDVAQHVKGRAIRLGAYGDPAAVPFDVWASLIAASGSQQWTGYTHQWKRCDQRLSALVMASADTREEAELARAMGWRHFRTRLETDALMDREMVCPASDEGGAKLDCASCLSCHGNANGRRGSVAIIIHGDKAKTKAYIALRVVA